MEWIISIHLILLFLQLLLHKMTKVFPKCLSAKNHPENFIYTKRSYTLFGWKHIITTGWNDYKLFSSEKILILLKICYDMQHFQMWEWHTYRVRQTNLWTSLLREVFEETTRKH